MALGLSGQLQNGLECANSILKATIWVHLHKQWCSCTFHLCSLQVTAAWLCAHVLFATGIKQVLTHFERMSGWSLGGCVNCRCSSFNTDNWEKVYCASLIEYFAENLPAALACSRTSCFMCKNRFTMRTKQVSSMLFYFVFKSPATVLKEVIGYIHSCSGWQHDSMDADQKQFCHIWNHVTEPFKIV